MIGIIYIGAFAAAVAIGLLFNKGIDLYSQADNRESRKKGFRVLVLAWVLFAALLAVSLRLVFVEIFL